MVITILGLTITLSLLYILSVWAQAGKTEAIISVTEFSGDSTLSINANNDTLEKILKELSEKCTITVVIYDKAILSRSITLSFKDLSIEQGIKKVLQAAGITNRRAVKYPSASRRCGAITMLWSWLFTFND